MSVFDGLKRLFSGGGTGLHSGDRGIYFFVRCDRCGETIRFRVDPTSELAHQYDEKSDAPIGYEVTKHVVGQKCFRTIDVTLTFDRGRRETSRSASGGTFVAAPEDGHGGN